MHKLDSVVSSNSPIQQLSIQLGGWGVRGGVCHQPAICLYTYTYKCICRFFPLASTARPCDPVVAALARGDAALRREVAQHAGEKQRQQRGGGPAGAAPGRRAREGLVGARVLVVAGAVVEEALNAAHARAVLGDTLRRAHAPPAAQPAGGQRTRPPALPAAAAAAVLALDVHTLWFGRLAAAAAQRLQLFLVLLGLGPNHLQEALPRRGAGPGGLAAGRLQCPVSARRGAGRVSVLGCDARRLGVRSGRPPDRRCRTLCVLIGSPRGPDPVQGEDRQGVGGLRRVREL